MGRPKVADSLASARDQTLISVALAVFLTALVCRSIPNRHPAPALIGGAIALLVVAVATIRSLWWPDPEPL